MLRNSLAGALVLVVASTCFATGEDLQKCLYNNGRPMDERVCATLNRQAARQEAQNQIGREQAAVRRAQQVEINERLEVQRQEKIRADEASAADYKAREAAANAMGLKAQQEQIEWEKAQDRAARARAVSAADATKKQKEVCGEDFRSPRVGMSLYRAKECVADFKLKGQINRADGVVSTYTAGQTYLHVMDGKIVSWGR